MGSLTLAATALVAAGGLLWGACLLRLYAVLYPADAVFALVALAGGGAAIGGMVGHRLGWLPSRRPILVAVGACAAGGLAVVVLSLTILGASFNLPLVNVLLAAAVYGAVGVSLAATYTLGPHGSGHLFAAQLTGAGLAAGIAPGALDALGPVDGSLLAAAALGAGGLAHAAVALQHVLAQPVAQQPEVAVEGDGERAGTAAWPLSALSAVAAVAAVAALPLNAARGWLSLDASSVAGTKSLFASLKDQTLREVIVHSEWTSVARTDVTEAAGKTDSRWVYSDGNVAGLIYRVPAGPVGPENAPDVVRADIGYVPFALPGAHEKVLIIGAGSGREIVMALAAGAKEVVAAEVSPGLIDAGRRFSGVSVLDQPSVRLVNLDGRTFLRTTREQFDLIYVSLPVAGAVPFGGATPGSYLHTLEAFDDYLDGLRQDGRLAMQLTDERDLTRAFNTAFQSLTRRGSTPLEAIRRLVAVHHQALAQQRGGGLALPLLIMRKTPYLEDEARSVFETVRETPFPPLFLPHLEPLSPFFSAFAAEEVGPHVIEAQAPFQIRPATDSSPFFFAFEKGVPWNALLAPALALSLAGGGLFVTRRPAADALDAEVEVPAEATWFLEDQVPWWFVGFVALVAAGFMLVYLPLAQRLSLLIGRPVAAAALTASTLLLGGGLGSMVAARVRPASLRPVIGWAALGAGLFAVALVELLPMASRAASGQSAGARMMVATSLVIPIALCLGIPFPSAVRLLAVARRGDWAALLWSIAVLSGLVAALLTQIIGPAWSYSYVLLLGAFCLLGAFMLAGLRRLAAENSQIEARSAASAAALAAAERAQYRRPAP